MKVVVVSHAMIQDAPRARWRRMAERHPVEVTLLIPAHWESTWFGGVTTWDSQPVEKGRFRVIPLPVTDCRRWGRYLFKSLDARLRQLKPDIIYVVQEELTFILHQIIIYRRLWVPRAKLVFFSWNNLYVPQSNWKSRLLWRRVCAGSDMAIAGNSEVQQVLQRARYLKPILVQTEIGVDETVFKPDPVARARVRAELGLRGFVIGFAGRITEIKGVLDLAEAVCNLSGEWTLLMVGNGDRRAEIEARFARYGLSDRLRVTRQVPRDRMPDYLRAMDCLVLPSHTTPTWKEQFGLVLAEAMLCGVPVVGSDSGAIPEVIGDAGMVSREGDVTQLADCLQTLVTNSELRSRLAKKGYERALIKYSTTALADETYQFYQQLIDGSIQGLF